MNERSGFDLVIWQTSFLFFKAEWIKAHEKSFMSCCSELCRMIYFICFVVNRIWCNGRRKKTDIGGTQLPSADGCNRSRPRPTICSEYARDAVGRWTGCKSSTMGQRVHFSTRSESIFGWVQAPNSIHSTRQNRQVLPTWSHPPKSRVKITFTTLLMVVQVKLNIFIVI